MEALVRPLLLLDFHASTDDAGVSGQFSLSDNLSGALYRSARKSAALDAVFTAQEYTSVSHKVHA